MVSKEKPPCRCVAVEGYGTDRTACRADEHRDLPPCPPLFPGDDAEWQLLCQKAPGPEWIEAVRHKYTPRAG